MVLNVKYIKLTVLVLVIVFFISTVFFIRKNTETNLLKTLIPNNTAQKSDITKIANKSSSVIKIVFEADTFHNAENLKKEFIKRTDKNYFEISKPDISILIGQYLANPENFLSYKTRELLKNKKYDEVYQNSIISLYNPSGIQLTTMDNDPYLLFDDFITSNRKISASTDNIDGKYYDYLSLKVKDDAGLSPDLVNKKISGLTEIQKSLSTNSDKIYLAGSPIHSYYTSMKSKITINIICILSTVLIISLTFLYFRSIKPLLPISISIIIGMLSGYLAVNLFFDNFQIITMVFSTTLIGIGIDYSYHYFFAEKIDRKFIKNLTFSLLTTIIPFILLYLTGIELLKQISIFTTFGLSAIYMTVLVFYPCFNIQKPVFSVKINSKIYRIVSVVLIFLGLIGFIRFKINDTLSAFYNPSKKLIRAEQLYTKVSGEEYNNTKVITVENDDLEGLLQDEEKITDLLNNENIEYTSLSKFIPSLSRQKENFDLVKALYKSNLDNYSDILSSSQIENLKNKSFNPIYYNPILYSYLNDFFISPDKSMIFVFEDIPVKLEQKNVQVIDVKSDIENYIRGYRHKLFLIFPIVTFALFILLSFIYGIKDTIKILIPPYVGILASAGITSLVMGEINLFGFITIFLILGFTMDYSIFRISKENRTEDAIFISWFTTSISFLLLTLAGFKLVSSMALILFFGIVSAYFIGYIIFKERENNHSMVE